MVVMSTCVSDQICMNRCEYFSHLLQTCFLEKVVLSEAPSMPLLRPVILLSLPGDNPLIGWVSGSCF